MPPAAELRVPTVAVRVRLAVRGHGPAVATDAELFLADVPRRDHAQLLDDVAALFEGSPGFVPVRTGETVRLYGTHAIAWIAIARADRADRADDVELQLFERRHPVAIALVSGGELTGLLFDSSPADRPRVVDCLNRAGRFVRLWTPGEHYLVATDEILHVSERE